MVALRMYIRQWKREEVKPKVCIYQNDNQKLMIYLNYSNNYFVIVPEFLFQRSL